MAIDAAAGLTGGCQCGAVRYRLMAEPTGVEHLPLPNVPEGERRSVHGLRRRAAFGIRLHQRRDRDLLEFGHRRARLLRRCGTPLTYQGSGSDRISVTLGSLDDPGAVEPRTQLGVESKVPLA